MKVFEVDNVNEAVARSLPYLLAEGLRETSRNGDVIVAPGPVMTIYNKPCERVLFSQTRDANPFFHLMESLWMLCGRNDLAFPLYFNKRFAGYSDNGMHIHGAYGHRWRKWFGIDQLGIIVRELQKNPDSRRAVLTMWSPLGDLVPLDLGNHEPSTGGLKGKDVPCNTQCYFDLRQGKLNMTVTNRSNDAIWGAYGANVVHFSVLQEYLASWLEVEVGVYRQFSNNFHVYLDVYNEEKLQKIASESWESDYYKHPSLPIRTEQCEAFPLMSEGIDNFNEDLLDFFGAPDVRRGYRDPFFGEVAVPMYLAWEERKMKQGNGLRWIEEISATDWKLACLHWIARRERKH